MTPAGREYAFVAGDFVTVPELSTLKLAIFLSRHARIAKKRSVPRGRVKKEENRGDKIEHGQIARKDGHF
jgi:hypothetical protein